METLKPSDWIQVLLVIVALFYTVETAKMRKEMQKQLATLRKTSLLSALDVKLRSAIRVVEKDHTDSIGRNQPHFKKAWDSIPEILGEIDELIREMRSS